MSVIDLLGLAGATLQAAGFAVLFALVLASWGRLGPPGLAARLLAAALLLSLADGLATMAFYLWNGDLDWILPVRAAALGVWIVFLARVTAPAGLSLADRAIVALAIMAPVVALAETLGLMSLPVAAGPVLLMLASAGGLLLCERFVRGASAEQRRAFKFLLLALVAMLSFELLMLGVALAGSDVPVLQVVHGFLSAMLVPLFAVSIARNPDWSCDIFVSRQGAYGGLLLGGLGLFAALVVALGDVVASRYGVVGEVARAVLLVAAFLAVGTGLVSDRVRARLRLLLNRHFFAYNRDYREAWSRFIRTLAADGSHGGEPLPERVIRSVADVIDASGGAVWLHEREGKFRCLAVRGLPLQHCRDGVDRDFAASLEMLDGVIDLEAGEHHSAGVSLPAWVPRPPRAWLLLPLEHKERVFGFMMLAQARAPHALDQEDREVMRIAALEAASYLAEDDAARQLSEARQFEAFNRRFAFVMHDVKNIAGQLSLLVANARRHRGNPDFYDDMVETLDASVNRMTRLIGQLRADRQGQGEAVLLNQVLARLVRQRGGPRVELKCTERPLRVRADESRLVLALNHLIDNAFESGGPGTKVTVQADGEERMAMVMVEDDGPGMAPDFVRERLFRPFVSTKPAGMGLGMSQVRDVIEGFGGRIDVATAPGEGTRVRLHLPLLETEPAEAVH